MNRGKTRGQRHRLDDGLFIAVDRDGNVIHGTVNGPKLYVNAGVARRWAGEGGTVYMVTTMGITKL